MKVCCCYCCRAVVDFRREEEKKSSRKVETCISRGFRNEKLVLLEIVEFFVIMSNKNEKLINDKHSY